MNIIDQIASKSNLNIQQLQDYLFDAPLKYKHYFIPKRSFGRRLIAQPTAELKQLQRCFLNLISLPVHSSATAYRLGCSIKDNAINHKKSDYLLNMDLRNFFNSITTDVFWDACDKNSILISLNESERMLIDRLLFWAPTKNLSKQLVLSIGAPSSPTISNFIMYAFDNELNNYCLEQNITYTRYADDLSFSTNIKGALFDIPNIVNDFLTKHFNYQLLINHRKTFFSSKAHNRHITGITITNDDQISLGRKRKRYIKGLVFKYINNQLDDNKIMHLRGLLSFANHVEPAFIDRLKIKYSNKTIENITKG